MINSDKAYVLGLLIGGGTISANTFMIELPYRKWGEEVHRMREIATDILTKISDIFERAYGFRVNYEIGNSRWSIKPIGRADISQVIRDLEELGLPISGFLLNTADISKAKENLTGINAERFLSGIFDTRASLTKSHRRFDLTAPVVSVEIPGSTKNFNFVIQFCSWLTDLGSTTDQILFNHPCQHSASDPTYTGWKKGFKIRFLVKSFIAKHSFAMQAKAIDVDNLIRLQEREEQVPCKDRVIRNPSPVSIHNDINSATLPSQVRNRLFFHYHHFCAALGCPHAPYGSIKRLVESYNAYISYFPRLSKSSIPEAKLLLEAISLRNFDNNEIEKEPIELSKLLEDPFFEGYSDLKVGCAYLFSEELNGKRHVGNMNIILESSLNKTVDLFSINDTFDAPIILANSENNRAIVVSNPGGIENHKILQDKIEVNGLFIDIK